MDDYSERQPDWQSCSEAPVPSTIGPEERFARPLRELRGAVSLRTAIIGRLDPARETSGRVWPLPALPQQWDVSSRVESHSAAPMTALRLADASVEVMCETGTGSLVADDVILTSPSDTSDGFDPYAENSPSHLNEESSEVAVGEAVTTGADSSRLEVRNEKSPRAPSLLSRLQAWWRMRSPANKQRDREMPTLATRSLDHEERNE